MIRTEIITILLVLAFALASTVLVSFVVPLHYAVGDLVAASPNSDWTAGDRYRGDACTLKYLPAEEYLLRRGKFLWLSRSLDPPTPWGERRGDSVFHKRRVVRYQMYHILDPHKGGYDPILSAEQNLWYSKLVISSRVPVLLIFLLSAYPSVAFVRGPLRRHRRRKRGLGPANQQLSENDAMIWYDSRCGRFRCFLRQGCL